MKEGQEDVTVTMKEEEEEVTVLAANQ